MSAVHNTDFPDDQSGYYKLEGPRATRALKSPNLLFNETRSGASSVSYRELSIAHDWNETRTLIERSGAGGYLTIQFDHNDEAGDIAPTRGGTFYRRWPTT